MTCGGFSQVALHMPHCVNLTKVKQNELYKITSAKLSHNTVSRLMVNTWLNSSLLSDVKLFDYGLCFIVVYFGLLGKIKDIGYQL